MRIIGISAFYHDSAAALVQDGRIIESGKFDELVQSGGHLAELAKSQFMAGETAPTRVLEEISAR